LKASSFTVTLAVAKLAGTGGNDFIQIPRVRTISHHGGFWTVCGVEREALRKDLAQNGRLWRSRAGSSCIRLQQFDGRDRFWLGIGGRGFPPPKATHSHHYMSRK